MLATNIYSLHYEIKYLYKRKKIMSKQILTRNNYWNVFLQYLKINSFHRVESFITILQYTTTKNIFTN